MTKDGQLQWSQKISFGHCDPPGHFHQAWIPWSRPKFHGDSKNDLDFFHRTFLSHKWLKNPLESVSQKSFGHGDVIRSFQIIKEGLVLKEISWRSQPGVFGWPMDYRKLRYGSFTVRDKGHFCHFLVSRGSWDWNPGGQLFFLWNIIKYPEEKYEEWNWDFWITGYWDTRNYWILPICKRGNSKGSETR